MMLQVLVIAERNDRLHDFFQGISVLGGHSFNPLRVGHIRVQGNRLTFLGTTKDGLISTLRGRNFESYVLLDTTLDDVELSWVLSRMRGPATMTLSLQAGGPTLPLLPHPDAG